MTTSFGFVETQGLIFASYTLLFELGEPRGLWYLRCGGCSIISQWLFVWTVPSRNLTHSSRPKLIFPSSLHRHMFQLSFVTGESVSLPSCITSPLLYPLHFQLPCLSHPLSFTHGNAFGEVFWDSFLPRQCAPAEVVCVLVVSLLRSRVMGCPGMRLSSWTIHTHV